MRLALTSGIAILALAGGAQAASLAPYDGAIADASDTFAIPQTWIRAVIQVESAGNPQAVSRSGALGLMQIMPDTWAVLRQRLHLGADPFNPHDSVMAGTALLRELYDRFGPSGFLAAYNAGPKRYLAYLTGGEPLTAETRGYLAQIAPLLGDPVLAAAVQTPAGLADWRSASLFAAAAQQQPSVLWAAARPGNSPPAAPPAAVGSDDPPVAVPSRLEPQSSGLFATLSAAASP